VAVTLLFLGKLADVAGAGERAVPAAQGIDSLLADLEPDLAQALRGPRIRLAHNGALVSDWGAIALTDGDELAFLPPVSGG
jgi:molybdopterin synthase sulfur carrier subunit